MHYDHSNSTRSKNLYAGLRYGMLLLMLAPTVVAIPANAAEAKATQLACPALLLDHECRAYQADMSTATTADTQDAIKARYADLLSERERACFCSPERSWIQLTSTASTPQDTPRRGLKNSQDKPRIRL